MKFLKQLVKKKTFILLGSLTLIGAVSACGQKISEEASSGGEVSSYHTPEEGLRAEYWLFEELGPVPVPVMNPMTEEKVELGKKLFFDPRLSGNNQLSCISCHAQETGWSNGEKVATVNGQKGTRNVASIINAAFYKELNQDGSKQSLEEQALEPIQDPKEMDQDIDELVEELKAVPQYVNEFNAAFGEDISPETIAKALASFERTIIQRNTPFDRFMAGDDNALTQQEKWGMELFADKGNCLECHADPAFTDNDFDNLAIDNADVGRYLVTSKREDIGKFRTPQLRDLKYTAPYMHDGSMETLEEVMEHYNDAKHLDEFTSEDFIPLDLTEDEIAALVAFMENGLSGPPVKVDPPQIP